MVIRRDFLRASAIGASAAGVPGESRGHDRPIRKRGCVVVWVAGRMGA
ncbi:twin-arginine translocation signal domain-containing protein [Actinomadura pelletieri]